jgi:branched-chain amino acid transport system permease protein
VPVTPQTPPTAIAALAPPASSATATPRSVVFRLPRSANSPPTAAVLGALLALMGGVLLLDRTRLFPALAARPTPAAGARARARTLAAPGSWRWLAVAVPVVVLPPLLFNDSLLFKWGYLLIFVTAAVGMHVLVNWSGQLSLAHAAMIGLPAFVVGKLSADHAISPIVLLPLALVVGAAIGVFVALPALRVRGFYITVITLAAGVAIEQLFFTRSWLIGPGALSVPRPTLGPVRFTTFASLYPWMALVFVGTVAALRALYHSKVARAFFWIKADPDAAASAGVNTSLYIILAYVIAGLLAGMAGGLTAIWVRQLTPSNFPLSLAFSYLIVAVLAGPGPITGVLVTVFVLQGLPLFNHTVGTVLGYVTPVAVLVMLTRYPGGVNALGRRLGRSAWARRVRRLVPIPAPRGGAVPQTPTPAPSRMLLAGAALIVAGFAAIGLAWYHTGNTDQVWIQLQELASGGIGGMALVIVGTGLVVRDQLARNAAMATGAAPSHMREAAIFPIADYDDLKVFEIAPLLGELYPEELLVVRRHEEATKARAGILARIDKLLAGANDAGAAEPRRTVGVATAQ